MSDTDRATIEVAEDQRRDEWARLAQDDAGQPSPAPRDPSQPELPPEEEGQREAPPGSPAAAKPAGEERSETDELWATAPTALRETFEAERAARMKAENQVRTQDGRLSAETRRALQLQSERDALAQRVSASERPEEKAPVVDEAARGQLREEYPDVAGPLLDVIGGLEQTVRSLAARDASREDQQQAANQLEFQRFLAAEEQKLAENHPDWRETCATTAFADWAKAQPKFVWEGLERNGNGIVDATEAAAIVQLYKDAQGTGEAARRNAQLNGGRLPVGRIPSATTTTAADRAAEWARLDAQDRQQQQGRRANG